MNPLIQDHSGTAPETSRNPYAPNQRTNEDDSQKDPQLEVGVFQRHTTRDSGSEDGHGSSEYLRVYT